MNSKQWIIIIFILLGIVFSGLAINEFVFKTKRASVINDYSDNLPQFEAKELGFSSSQSNAVNIYEDNLDPKEMGVNFQNNKVTFINRTDDVVTLSFQDLSIISAPVSMNPNTGIYIHIEEQGNYFYEVTNEYLNKKIEGKIIGDNSFPAIHRIVITENKIEPETLTIGFKDRVTLENKTDKNIEAIFQNQESQNSFNIRLRREQQEEIKLEEWGTFYFQVTGLEKALEAIMTIE